MEGKDILTALSWGAVCHLKGEQSDPKRPHAISSPPYEMIQARKESQPNGPCLALGFWPRGPACLAVAEVRLVPSQALVSTTAKPFGVPA